MKNVLHKDSGLLTKLQRLRREIRAEFDVVATKRITQGVKRCWISQ